MRRQPPASTAGPQTTFGRRGLGLSCLCLLALAAIAGPGPAAAAEPPPGRAYELVSPANKPSGATGLSSRGNVIPARSADVPDRLVYGLDSAVGDSPSGTPNTLIFGERTATGWRARTAVRSTDDGNTPLEVGVHEPRPAWMSADGRALAFKVSRPLGWTTPNPVSQIFRAEDSDAAPEWLSAPVGADNPVAGVDAGSLSADGDLKTVAFFGTTALTPDAIPGTSAVYVWRDGGLQVAGRLPDASQSVPANGAYLANGNTTAPSLVRRNDVADNGRYVLFRAGGSSIEAPLYVRDLDAGVTRQLAGGSGEPDRAGNLASAAAGVPGSTVQDGLVYGAREAALAYFYGENASQSSRVMYEADLETGLVTARPAIDGAPVGLSADGQRMLFLTKPVGTGTDWELRYWDAADPDHSILVGTISGANATWGLVRTQDPSADGRTWVFTAGGSLDPQRPNVAPATLQLYHWTVGETTPTCLTCEPVDHTARSSGVRVSVQDGSFSETLLDPTTPVNPGEDVGFLGQPGHGLSDDGRWLLFDSPDRLVASDHNLVRDVYLWDRDAAPGRRLQLVTSGQGDTPSWALDLSPDGTNAFFSTREGLVPADKDGGYDVYSARIGDGFPSSPDSCVGEACRPPVIPPPPPAAAGSASFVGRGNLEASAGPGTPRLRAHAAWSAASGLKVRVDAPKAGRIQVSGPRVRTTTRRAKRQATYALGVPLTAATRRKVAGGRPVKVSLRVAFTPQGAEKASVVHTSVSIRKGR